MVRLSTRDKVVVTSPVRLHDALVAREHWTSHVNLLCSCTRCRPRVRSAERSPQGCTPPRVTISRASCAAHWSTPLPHEVPRTHQPTAIQTLPIPAGERRSRAMGSVNAQVTTVVKVFVCWNLGCTVRDSNPEPAD